MLSSSVSVVRAQSPDELTHTDSSVMDMPEAFRPAVYSSVTGQIEPFPSALAELTQGLTPTEPNDMKRHLHSQMHRDVGLYRKPQ